MMAKKLRIGVLLRNRHDGPGGLEQVLSIVSKLMLQRNVELKAYSLYPLVYTDFLDSFSSVSYLSYPPYFTKFRDCIPKRVLRLLQKFYVAICGKRLFKTIVDDDVDILLTLDLSKQFLKNYRRLKYLKTTASIPVVSWVHSNLSVQSKGITALVRSKIELFDKHFAISKGLAQELGGLYQVDNISLIYNPVISGKIVDRNVKKLLYVGRIDDNKRVHAILDNLIFLKGDWILDIYGSTGSLAGDVAFDKYIDGLGMRNKIVFHGWKKKPWDHIDSAGVLLLNSKKEAFGLVLVEAMQRGIPVVSANSPSGPKELVINGVNGWLYSSEGDDNIVNILQDIIDEKLVLPSQERVKESVKRFDQSVYIYNFLEAVEEIVKYNKQKKV